MQIATATATLDWLDECRAQEGISRRLPARENPNKRAKSENLLRWNEYQQVMAKANRDANDGFSGKKNCGRIFRRGVCLCLEAVVIRIWVHLRSPVPVKVAAVDDSSFRMVALTHY